MTSSVQRHSTHTSTMLLMQLPVIPPAAFAATGNTCLAPACLAAAAATDNIGRNCDIQIADPELVNMMGDTALVDWIGRQAPDVIGCSLYLWNTERSLRILRRVRALSPEVRIIVGGPDIEPDNTCLVQRGCFDIAVSGEGEGVLPAVLTDAFKIRNKRLGADMQGSGKFVCAADSGFPLDRYPSPYLAGLLSVIPGETTYVETARGCPSHCSYCFYSRGKASVRRLPLKDLEYLLSFLHERGATNVSLLDPAFNRRSDFTELLKVIARANRKRRMSFFAEINAEALPDDSIRMLARAGFTRIEVGLQSVNTSTLRRVGRGGNPDAIIRKAVLMKKSGIDPLVDLMVGLPGDTIEDVVQGVGMLQSHGLADAIQVLPLSVLPGTRMRRDAARHGLVYDLNP